MSTPSRHPNTIRQGGPGASEENAKAPLEIEKPAPQSDAKRKSDVSGGGGERDSHHTHDAQRKGGNN